MYRVESTLKNQILSTVSALVLTTLLTACGGQQDVQMSNQTAAATSASAIQATPLAAATGTNGAATTLADAASAPAASAAAGITVAANMPQPDCAADGCNSLRIIDGNAEAWRVDAARRASLEARL